MITPLAEAMQALGLAGEVSRSGRWIRFHSRQGFVYVVESAWGGSYHMFCDPPTQEMAEIYLDPVTAIQAGLQGAVGTRAVEQERQGREYAVGAHA